MKKFALLPLALLFLGSAAFADDQLRNVQTELKGLGFYYGEVDGQKNAETTAAIRRYQIRNGLEVTGTLTQDTLAAMGMGPKKSPPVAAVKPAPVAPPEKKSPPVNLRREPSVEESDRKFLVEGESRDDAPDAVAPLAPYPPAEPPSRDRSIIDPPQPLDAPSPDFPVLFAGTPYARTPLSVQRQALRKAQAALAEQGFYRDVVDGLPGPATEEAILSFQHSERLTLTGRLDVATLDELRLLPPPSSSTKRTVVREPRRPYRGIWINRGGLRFGLEFH